MADWVKVGTNVVVGGVLGAGDQLVQNWDERREEERGEKLGVMSQFGTYYNYGLPILAILGTAMGWLRGDWATRVVTAGSTLAGRKATKQLTKKGVVPYTAWKRVDMSASQQRHLAEARRQLGGQASQVIIPVVADETMLV